MKTQFAIVVHLLVIFYARMMLTHEDRSAHKSRRRDKWEKALRSASSLEELLKLTDFHDTKLWKPRLRLKHAEPPPSREPHRSPPLVSHRSTRYAAAPYSTEVTQQITQEILQAIDEEWQKTQCMPRETCVDVAKELGTNPGMFFKPPCVSVFRCSGCCHSEAVTCRNTSTTYVNKTLFSVIPFKYKPEPVLIRVANHTECECMEPALIRRHTPQHRSGCFPAQWPSHSEATHSLCSSGLIWDCAADQCVPYPSRNQGELHRPLFRCHLNSSICATDGKRVDQASCSCE
ncbi:vascular endothelial growth factor D-like isoform X1 [Anguilla rostrata]|uniref:Platelet-derived growth factor (PDGF) family profile domain-containing protein n=1 Tax=Anguilla anguilla TaxID=7936 RepID=A0A9D3RK67_ANGAN|nr:vascular endothelial growth factor D-like isoform X1 [Anguilla anguilla]KAG5833531.1 hypothetical protein ANANG_G00276890 [Anguilla anguilla]